MRTAKPSEAAQPAPNFIHTRFDCAKRTALVQHQADENDPVAPRQLGGHGIGIGHLRHELGIHEARGLDSPHPGVERMADEIEFLRGAEQHRFILQPVARTDFDNFNVWTYLALYFNILRI